MSEPRDQAHLWIVVRQQASSDVQNWKRARDSLIHPFTYSFAHSSIEQMSTKPSCIYTLVGTQKGREGGWVQSGKRDRRVIMTNSAICALAEACTVGFWKRREAHLLVWAWGWCQRRFPRPCHHWTKGISQAFQAGKGKGEAEVWECLEIHGNQDMSMVGA